MADYILIQPPGEKRWVRARETDLPNEAALQELMKEHPETLPLEDLDSETQPLLIVGRESLIGNGYVDVIGVDPSGLVTIIECKLDRNPDAKRTVIGQVLGYGAYLWRLSYATFEEQVVRPYFDSPQRCHRADLVGLPLSEAMERFVNEQALGGEWSSEQFRHRLEGNLLNGHLRLVIVVDKVNDELRRTIEFLNDCTAPQFQCVCAELRHYASDGVRLLVPTLIGVPKTTPAPNVGPRPKWTEAQFFSELATRAGSDAASAVRRFLPWCQQTFDWISWGTGKTYPSFIVGLNWTNGRVATLFAVYPYGKLEVGFAYLKPFPPFVDEMRRRALLAELNSIPGIALPADSFDRRPSFAVKALTVDETLTLFQKAMQTAVSELTEAREQQKAVAQLK